jgi:hypothetical protein
VRPRSAQALRLVVAGLAGVVVVFGVVRVDEGVDGRMTAPVNLHEQAVAADADRCPYADLRLPPEHVAGHLERDGGDVPVRERVLPDPLEAVKGTVRVGDERVTAHTDEQPGRAGLDRLGGGVEADRGIGDPVVRGNLRSAAL